MCLETYLQTHQERTGGRILPIVDPVGKGGVFRSDLRVPALVIGERKQVLRPNVHAKTAHGSLSDRLQHVIGNRITDSNVLQAQVRSVLYPARRRPHIGIRITCECAGHIGIGVSRRPRVQHGGTGAEQASHPFTDNTAGIEDLITLYALEKYSGVEIFVPGVEIKRIRKIGQVITKESAVIGSDLAIRFAIRPADVFELQVAGRGFV